MITKNPEDATIIGIQKWIRGTLTRKSLLVTMPEYSAFIFRKRNRENYGPKIMYDSNLIFDDFANELRRHKLKSTAKPQTISNSKIEEKIEDNKDLKEKFEENVIIKEPEIKENQQQDERIVNNEEKYKEKLEEKKIGSIENTENSEKQNTGYLSLEKLNEIDRKSIQSISVRAVYSPDSSRRSSEGSDIDGDISPELSKDISVGDVNTSRHKDIFNSDIEDISYIENEENGAIIHDKSQEKINENQWQEEQSASDKEERSASDKEGIAKSIENKDTENLIQMAAPEEKSKSEINGFIGEKEDGNYNAENSPKNLQIDHLQSEIGSEKEVIVEKESDEEKSPNESHFIKEKTEIPSKISQDIKETDNIQENPYKDAAAEEEKIKTREENAAAKIDNSEGSSEQVKNTDTIEYKDKEPQAESIENLIENEKETAENLENKQCLDKDKLKNEAFMDSDKIENHEKIEKEEAIKAHINEQEKEVIMGKEIVKIISSHEEKNNDSNRIEKDSSYSKNQVLEEEKVLATGGDFIKNNQDVKEENKKAEIKTDSPKEEHSGSFIENKLHEVDNPKQISEKEIEKISQEDEGEVPNAQQNLYESIADQKSFSESRDTPIIKESPREAINKENSIQQKIDQPIKHEAEIKPEKSNRNSSPSQKLDLDLNRENSPEKAKNVGASKDTAKELLHVDIDSKVNLNEKGAQGISENSIESNLSIKQEAEINLMKPESSNSLEGNKIDTKNEAKSNPESQPNTAQESSIGIANSENSNGKVHNNTAEISVEFQNKTELATANKDNHDKNLIIKEASRDLTTIKDEKEGKLSNIIKLDSQRSEKEKYSVESEESENKIKKEGKDLENSYEEQKDYKAFEINENLQNEKDQSYEKIDLDSKSARKNSIKANISITESKTKQEKVQNSATKYQKPTLISSINAEIIPEERKEFNTTDNIINHKAEEKNSENPPIPENKARANSDNFPPPKKLDSFSKQPFHRNFQKKSDRNAENTDKKDKKISSQAILEEEKRFTPEYNKNSEKIVNNDIFADQDSQSQNPLFNPPPQSVRHNKSKPPLPKEEKDSSFIQEELKDLKKFPSNRSHQTPAFSIYSDGSSYLSDKSINVISSRVTPIQSGININDPSTPLWSQSPNELLQKDPDSMLRKNFYQKQELRGSKNPILPHLDQPTLTKKRSPKSQEFFENPAQKIPKDSTNFSSTPAKFKSKSLNQTHYHANPYNNEPVDLNFDPEIYKSKKSKTKNSKELEDITNPKTAAQSKKSTSYGKYRFQYNLQPKSSTNVLVLDKGSPYELEKGMKMLQEFFGVKVDIMDNNHKKKIRIIKPKLQNIKLPAIKTKKVLKKGNLVL